MGRSAASVGRIAPGADTATLKRYSGLTLYRYSVFLFQRFDALMFQRFKVLTLQCFNVVVVTCGYSALTPAVTCCRGSQQPVR